MNAHAALQILNLTLLAAERGIPLMQQAAEIKRKVAEMEAEERDPTTEEWNGIIAMLGGDAEDTIEDAAARARANAARKL
jgi:hypothetical protein